MSGKQIRSIHGSGDVVRALCKLPDNHPSGAQLASASNDGVIRLWTIQGQQIAELRGHESFIYSLATLPSGEIVSAGEDRTVRVWDNNRCIQTITHPAISVWGVSACQENGDIVTGASDRVTRVFSRAEVRQADDSIVQQFESSVKESSIPQQQVGNINKEKLPGPEFLKQRSGTKEGQVQMVREDNGNVTAHTWSTASQEWIAVGTVVDSAGSSGKKVEYRGQDYDYVFDVDIEDGKPPLKLPYNLSQNPYEAATRFIGENQLPTSYIDQVANFITTNTQGASIGPAQPSSETTGSSAPQTSSLPTSRPNVLPQTSYLAIKTANLKAIQRKIHEINEQLISAGSKDISLNPSELETVTSLCAQLEQSSPPKESPAIKHGLPLVAKMATVWPPANRIPGLDLLRLLAAVTPLTATVDYNQMDIISTLISSGVFESPLNANNAMLTVRMFANLFETEPGRNLAVANFNDILAPVGSLASNSQSLSNRNLTIAITTLCINYSVFFTSASRAKSPESEEKALVILEVLTKILTKEKDSEAVYRGLVALGTLVNASSSDVKTAAKDIYEIEKILSAVLSAGLGREPRIKGVVDEVRNSLK